MSNTINPYVSSRSDLQRSVQPSDKEEDGQRPDPKKANIAQQGNGLSTSDSESAVKHDKIDPASAKELEHNPENTTRVNQGFGNTIGDSLDVKPSAASAGLKEGPQPLEGLTPDEQQLIYRYFPESPSLQLRLYKPDMSADKVDPGSVGSRVDIRG